MRVLAAFTIVSVLLSSNVSQISGQTTTTKVFLLEDAANKQWCAYNKEATWKAAVQDLRALTVGALTYSSDQLAQIDVTETDESGDWIVYDNYSVDDHGQIVKLSRMINVLPGDRSVSETFSISDRKARKSTTTEKQLSTGQLLTSPKSVWLPEVPIMTATKQFPFSGLLGRSDLPTSSKVCAQISVHREVKR